MGLLIVMLEIFMAWMSMMHRDCLEDFLIRTASGDNEIESSMPSVDICQTGRARFNTLLHALKAETGHRRSMTIIGRGR